MLGGSAHGVFNGKIVVHKDAQKSDARQTNKNLLLSDSAVIDTKPQLEIHADDVKCSHGSTIGQLDADALFYLRSRGLDRAAARSLLSFAFASDVVRRLGIENLRQRLDALSGRAIRSMVIELMKAMSQKSEGIMAPEQVRRCPGAPGLSHPQSEDSRQAAGLSRQRRHQPKAAVRDRRYRPLLQGGKCQYPPRRALTERAATAAYEAARGKTARLYQRRVRIEEIIFVRGTTEAINLVAQSYGRAFLKAGDEIVVSAMEHHSNIVPWQMLCEQVGAKLRVIPINHDGEIVMEEYRALAQ